MNTTTTTETLEEEELIQNENFENENKSSNAYTAKVICIIGIIVLFFAMTSIAIAVLKREPAVDNKFRNKHYSNYEYSHVK